MAQVMHRVPLVTKRTQPTLSSGRSRCNALFVTSRGAPRRVNNSPRVAAQAQLPGAEGTQGNTITAFVQHVGKTCTVLLASGTVLLSSFSCAADEVFRFPASSNPEIFAAERTLVEAWQVVGETYVDDSFAGMDWGDELRNSLMTVYNSTNGAAAYKEVQGLIAKLGDPFTRLVPPNEYLDFRVTSDGEVQGVGLLIAADPSSGKLVVLAPIQGGPAFRAGIQPGDEVLSIDGRSTDGWDGDRAAQVLRGSSGSSVMVQFARRSEQIPGVPGRPEAPPKVQLKQVKLKREKLELSPVYTAMLNYGEHMLGYIKLLSFSQNAAADMEKAISSLQESGVDGFILDLRNNPGGLVKSGLGIARLWLGGSPTVLNVEGREEDGLPALQTVVLEEGDALTDKPLAVLVNGNSASASEILAGALHDNHRAELIGDTTFGKGKIQSVFELGDGSALFVTVARYKTPAMSEIDKIGIRPDKSCSVVPILEASRSILPLGPSAADLAKDGCVHSAEEYFDTLLASSNQPGTQVHANFAGLTAFNK